MAKARVSNALMAVFFGIAALAAGLFLQTSAALAADGPVASSNAWANGYRIWASTSKSALTVDSSGNLQRVEYVDDTGLVVETYTPSGKFLSGKTVDASTYQPSDLAEPSKFLWGGVFCGENYNFVVTGQSNLDQDNDLKVVRFTEYDKDWGLRAVVEANRINTYIPFDAGSCAMAESGGVLMVRTCHEMYQSSDGYHHQASMAFSFKEGTMQPLSAMSGVMNISQTALGYVSHSFDQKLVVLNGTFYSLDLGDAYPRCVVMKKLGSTGSSSYTSVKSISGNTGDNNTFTTIGGLAASQTANTLLAVGTQRDQSAVYSASKYTDYPRNVWLSVVNPGTMRVAKQVSLTSYAKGSSADAENPQIVQVADDEFLVMWGVKEGSDRSTVDYAFVDGNGNIVKETQSFSGELSDCQPIVTGGKVIWYVTGTSSAKRGPLFYAIDTTSRTASIIGGAGEISADSVTCQESATYTGSAIMPKVEVRFGGLTLAEGVDYTLACTDNVKPGTATVTVSGTGNYSGAVKKDFEIEVAEEDQEAVESFSDLVWELPSEVESEADREDAISVIQGYEKLTTLQKSLVSEDDASAVESARELVASYDARKAEAEKAKTGIAVNAKTVSATTLRSAAAKAGVSLKKVKTVTLDKKVKTLKAGFLKGCGAKTLVVKTTKLTKKSAKNSLKGSKVTTVRVDTGSEMADVDVAHWYTVNVFTKANCGKKVSVTW